MKEPLSLKKRSIPVIQVTGHSSRCCVKTRRVPSYFRYSMLTSSPSASTSSAPAPRLLYRGGLSLPDSHIILDGLTFYAPHNSPSKVRDDLLGNPLALALETMRGRPTLRLMGTLKLNAIWVDSSGGDVFMYVCNFDSEMRVVE